MATAAGSKIFQNIPVPILFILISCLVSFGKASKPAEMSSRAAFIHSNQTFGVGCSRQSHSTRFKIPAFSDFRQFADEPLQLVKPDLNHKRLLLVKENIKVRNLTYISRLRLHSFRVRPPMMTNLCANLKSLCRECLPRRKITALRLFVKS